MEFASDSPGLRLRMFFTIIALTLAFGAGQARADTLPGPDFTSGPALGEILNTDDVDISFVLDPATLTGGVLGQYLCSLDGAAFTACTSPIHLADLSAGAHTFGVKAELTLLGGQPICVLGVCVDPGPLTVETAVSTTGFTVDLSGGTGLPGDPTGGTGGTDGTNGADGTDGTPGATMPGVKTVSANLTRQMARCKKLRKKLRKHFNKRSNRVRVRKRYMRCIKVQRRMAAQATTAAMRK